MRVQSDGTVVAPTGGAAVIAHTSGSPSGSEADSGMVTRVPSGVVAVTLESSGGRLAWTVVAGDVVVGTVVGAVVVEASVVGPAPPAPVPPMAPGRPSGAAESISHRRRYRRQ